jgi:ABC-type nitrate/sulfonate/bicarbonate transport system substrate-binding protein
VDGVLTWPPFVQQIMEKLGDRVVVFDGQPGQDYYYLALTREEWLAQNPQIAERVVQALKMAEHWINDHPKEARDYMAAKFSVSPAEMEKILASYRFAVTLPQTLLTAMESETRWLDSLGEQKGTRVNNFLDLIAFDPLNKVSPADVTIVH